MKGDGDACIPRWMSGLIVRDRLRNDCVRDNLKIASIHEKLREIHLWWFGHIIK